MKERYRTLEKTMQDVINNKEFELREKNEEIHKYKLSLLDVQTMYPLLIKKE